MIKHLLIPALGLIFLTGCEYSGPRKPTKLDGLAKHKYKQRTDNTEIPEFLKKFIEEENVESTPSSKSKETKVTSNVEATAVTLPNFKGDYLKKLRSKYPLLDTKKIEDKDLIGMLEIYSQELNKIKARLQ